MTKDFLSQNEVDALLKDVVDDSDLVSTTDPSEIHAYDISKQERIVRGRMATLEIINDRFARLFRIGLFNFLRRSIEVSVGPVSIIKYSEFIRNLVMPTNLNLVQIHPLRGPTLMVIDPGLVFLIVDNMFGGEGKFHNRVEGRDFTLTEHRIIRRVLDIVFENYAQSWAPVYPVTFEYLRSEMNTQFANIATPNEVVVTSTFTIEIANTRGEIHFCIPYSTIEPIRDLLTSPLQGEILGIDQRWGKLITEQIQSVDIELVSNLGTINMHVRDVIALKVGDVLPISLTEEIQAHVEGIAVFSCKYGTSNGQYALHVNKIHESNEMEYVKGKNNDD